MKQWQRAEVLGALVNGVFLLALCLSIFLEAVQRLLDPPDITNPVLILCVGSAGLASNIVGLFLFHDHGHGHGGHDHGKDEEHGHVTYGTDPTQEHGGIGELLPGTVVSAITNPDTTVRDTHPEEENENTPLLNRTTSHPHSDDTLNVLERCDSRVIHAGHNHTRPHTPDAHGHSHGGHSHGDLNMRGVFLHVLGDALGNVGVIATALFILYSDWKYKFYADPVISLFITCIIFSSAMPLCKSAGKILLQAVPGNINLEEVKADLGNLPGVEDVHELHIWQLSDTKMVSSVHVRVSFDGEGEPAGDVTARYNAIDRAIRSCLHAYGIHSSTIQQEFVSKHPNSLPRGVPTATAANGSASGDVLVWRRNVGNVLVPSGACLLDCGESCEGGKCCPAPPASTTTTPPPEREA